MHPTTLLCGLALLSPVTATAADGNSGLKWIAAQQSSPESCERRVLLGYLQHEDVRVRSAALDLLESVIGHDFGIDPWLPPDEVPPEVQKALNEWVAAEELVGDAAKAPAPQQLADAVVLLRSTDPDTQRRVCLRFASWKAALAAAIQSEKLNNKELTELELDNLRCSLYRLQLQNAIPAEVGRVAPLLASHARKDILTGLESLRNVGKDALPVLMEFIDSQDGLVREVAVDVLLQTGNAQAYKIIMPKLMAELDRNILQIAARRAPDCAPLPQIVEFLNHCAVQQDEDVAVAALEALADMEADDDVVDSGEILASAKHAMGSDSCLSLLKSPNWRVRAAMLRALTSTENFIPSIRNEELQKAVLAALRDVDETVRLHAMQVLHKRNLVSSFLSELDDYALKTPNFAPYLVYLFCRQKREMSPALAEYVSRFSPEQVDLLVHYEDEYDTVFNTSSRPNRWALGVIESLMANPDPRVRHKVMAAWGHNLYCQKSEWAHAFVDWLQEPSAPAVDKIEPLRLLVFRNSEQDRRLGCDERLSEWLMQESEHVTIQDARLQQIVYAALLELRPAMVAEPDVARLQQMPPDLLDVLLRNRPALILRMERGFASKLIKDDSFCSFLQLLSLRRQNPEIMDYLASLELNDEQWTELVKAAMQREYSFEDEPVKREPEIEVLSPFILKILQAEGAAQNFRVIHTAYLLLLNGTVSEPVSAVIESAPESQRAALECLRDVPRKSDAVEPWARKYYNSPHAAVRRAVAGCLLPYKGWFFYIPRTGEQPPYADTENRVANLADDARASCPVSLIRLVQAMQADDDPAVAFIACCSLLYRTGDCDRTRMQQLLNYLEGVETRFRQLKQENKTEQAELLSAELSTLREVADSVWYRWYEYRSAGNEFFKLKGTPKKLRPGLAKLLEDFARKTQQRPYAVIEEVRDSLNFSGSSRSASGGLVQAHEFDYPQATVEVAPTTPTPLPESVEEPDADEPEETTPAPAVEAPVRVEFFHKDGCEVCEQVQQHLDNLKSDFPGLAVTSYDVESEAGRERNTVLSARFGVPLAERRKAPAIFTEGGCLLGSSAAERNRLHRLLADSRAIGGRSSQLAENPQPTEQGAQSVEPSPTPVPVEPSSQGAPEMEPQPLPGTERLAAATPTETAAATGEQLWEQLRSYGVLAIGGVITLLGLVLLLFGRTKDSPQD